MVGQDPEKDTENKTENLAGDGEKVSFDVFLGYFGVAFHNGSCKLFTWIRGCFTRGKIHMLRLIDLCVPDCCG